MFKKIKIRVLVPPQGIYLSWVYLSCSLGTKTPPTHLPTQVENGDYMLNTSSRPQAAWNQKVEDWDSPSTTLLPHHQSIRRKSCSLQPSPPNIAFKNALLEVGDRWAPGWAAGVRPLGQMLQNSRREEKLSPDKREKTTYSSFLKSRWPSQ